MRKKTRDQQQEIYNIIIAYKIANAGISPTIRELCTLANIKSRATISKLLTELKNAGKINYQPTKPRTITIPGSRWLPPTNKTN